MAWSDLSLLYDVLEVVIPLGLLPVVALRHRATTAIGWLLLALVLPVLGLLLYLVFGGYRKRRRERGPETLPAELHRLVEDALDMPVAELAREDDRLLSRVVERAGFGQLGSWRALDGNAVEVHDDPRGTMDRLIEDVECASRSVHLLFYTFDASDTATRLAGALSRAARRGVACRLQAGAFSSRFEGDGSFFRTLAPDLENAGVEICALEPLNPFVGRLLRADLRNHRKIAVIDGAVAWTGSQNVHDPSTGLDEGEWHQLMVRIEGPAARQLQGVFLSDWARHDRAVPPREEVFPDVDPAGTVPVQTIAWGPAGIALPPSLHAFAAALGAAREQLRIAVPYFVPDPPLLLALRLAAYRDVEVDLVIPERCDRRIVDAAARASLGELLEAGVRVHLHRGGLLHAKCLSIDDSLAWVGSSNLDQRSLYLDLEANVLVYDREVADAVRASIDGWIGDAVQLETKSWRARPFSRRVLDNMAGLLGPLL